MLISVIIPTYNESGYISKCLISLQRQKLGLRDGLEIMVIDDGSTDDTVERVKRLQKNSELAFPVALLHQPHQGPAIARNQAAKSAKGEVLVFVDADMEFDKHFIKYLAKPIREGLSNGTFSKEEYVANWDNPLARCWNWNQNLPSRWNLKENVNERRRVPDNSPGASNDFRAILKSEFIKVGGFDNVGYTDTWTLAKKLGYKPINALGAIFYHHNPGSLNEVFKQAKWTSKRQYKFGPLGLLIGLVRASLPVSLVLGLFGMVKYKELWFGVFKLVYDAGVFGGILEMILRGRLSK